MTDSNAIKRIYELLDERGIDYKLRRASATSARETVFWEYEKDGDWATAEYAVTVPQDGYGNLNASRLTPEQAVAATLGAGEAWNSRAERTCFADEVTHRDCKYSVNRGWRERTCECIVEYAKSPLDGKTIVLHRCSSCNELMRPHMNYCPNCGAKVVGE